MSDSTIINAMDATPTYPLPEPNGLMSNGYPLLEAHPPKNDYAIHKFMGPALAAGVTGGIFGGAMNPKNWKRAALIGTAAGAANAILFRAIIKGYAAANKVPYKEVIAEAKVFKPKKIKPIEEKAKSYGSSVAAVAPIFAAKAVLGDMPRKALEETIEQRSIAKLKKLPPPPGLSVAKKGLTGRGLRTAAVGGGIGILTAPVFLKGVQMAASDDIETKVKGVGLIAGSGAVYQAAKGFGEGSGVAKSRGLGTTAQINKGISYSVGRILLKSPAAIATGLAIASGRKKSKDGKEPGVGKKYVLPALAGAAIGGVQNVVNTVVDAPKDLAPPSKNTSALRAVGRSNPITGNPLGSKWPRRKALLSRKGMKNLAPAGKSGVVGGLIGGLVAATVVDKAVKALKQRQKRKHASPQQTDHASSVRRKLEYSDSHRSWNAPWDGGRNSKAFPWFSKMIGAQGGGSVENYYRMIAQAGSRIPDPAVRAKFIRTTNKAVGEYREAITNNKLSAGAKKQRAEALKNMISRGPAG